MPAKIHQSVQLHPCKIRDCWVCRKKFEIFLAVSKVLGQFIFVMKNSISQKKQFVVINENILGMIRPESPEIVEIVASSISKGATVTWQDGMIGRPRNKSIRRANKTDFENFRVNFDQYAKFPNEYRFSM